MTTEYQQPSVWEELLNIADDVQNAKDRPTLRDAAARLRAIGACDACAGTGVGAKDWQCPRCAWKGVQSPWDRARNRAYFRNEDGTPKPPKDSDKIEAPF
jgi:hypothetical protein